MLRKFKIYIAILLLCAFGFAQDRKEEDEIIRIETKLINVPVIVTDTSGKPVLNLKRENFVIYEDGKKQEIASFSLTEAPFEIALLLDTSGSTRNELPLIRRAASYFISSLRKDDKVAIVSFQSVIRDGKQVAVSQILTGLTEERLTLEKSLANISTSGGTPYYDAMLEILNKVFNEEPTEKYRGRRAIVALTDGVDSVSVADFDEVLELVQKKGILVYFIQLDTRDFFEEGLLQDCEIATKFSAAQLRRYYKQFGAKSKVEKTYDFCSLGYFERLAISKKLYEIADYEMQRLAKESGGQVFPVVDLSEARRAFKQIAEAIGASYSLGYYSSNESKEKTYRKIRVELRGVSSPMNLRYREGYEVSFVQ
ncbi:MAG: VWA domain-containing protein [Pyrinomonadaceae bacterium]|nr:VWA domain-containing protein [Pyrinomonadaceae bacterium]MCX7639271.1 VWA domain-containing protein [Pyrinomonadaceae bacterium]MDW8303507.1 VWA domain-containing protein [Acidobacteriota bacterium]